MPKGTISWKSLPSNGLIVVEGQRGQGKTSLAWYLAETKRVEKRGKRVIAFGMPDVAKKALPKWITHMQSLEEVSKAKPSIVIIDEAAFIANSRRAMQETNIEWLKLIAICRHKDHLLIFIHQQSRQLDIQIMMDADLVLLKRPTQLHLRGARAEFKPEIQEAYALFENMRGDTRKKVYAIDYHYGKKAMLQASMPTWWSNKVSKAYSSVSV